MHAFVYAESCTQMIASSVLGFNNVKREMNQKSKIWKF